MPYITVRHEGMTIEYASGKSLANILLDAGVHVDNACVGRGVCGKCRVRIEDGDAGALTETEKRILSSQEISTGMRLSCLVFPQGDITVDTLNNDNNQYYDIDFIGEASYGTNSSKENGNLILTEGYMPDFEYDVDLSKYPDAERIYGVAVDIGTTTVVCSLVDMMTGEEIGQASDINSQVRYGLDVLTRITYEIDHPDDGIKIMHDAAIETVNKLIGKVCDECGVSAEEIYEITVAANCTMMHMLLGMDATSIGRYPFTPIFTESKYIDAKSIGLRAAEGAKVYCLPSVSSYIGADIAAGAYVCDLSRRKGNVLFVDIGTNGEMVLSTHGRMISCSCAAGPALEGMNISSGMRAADGAIEDVRITEAGIELEVIGGITPVGICGSGILAAIRELSRTGIIKPSGTFVKPARLPDDDFRRKYLRTDDNGGRYFVLNETEQAGQQICITQTDIRQVQLAKGALLSGFMALMNRSGINPDELGEILIAGQFGAHLPAESITGAGILPPEFEGRIKYVGNTSRGGAYMALMSEQARHEMEELASEIEYIELGETENYQELLAECMIFPEVL